MRTIASHWESYRAKVIPKDASAIQILECRRAFYAGAQSLLSLSGEISEPSVSEEAGVLMLAGLHDESRRFFDEVQAGRA